MQGRISSLQKPTSKLVWDSFKTSFQKHLKTPQLSRLRSPSERKYFFKDLFEIIAKDLGYEYSSSQEFLRVDYTIFKTGEENKWHVPIIAIESENCWESCYEEATKLCSINAPLKILIAYGYPEERKKEMNENDSNWDYILEDFANETQLVGWYAVLIYDDTKEGAVTFKTFVYNDQGIRETNETGELIVLN